MFVEMYTSISIFGLDNGIINYTTYSQVGHSADRIAAIAGSMQIMIPYIAYQAVAGSAGGLMHFKRSGNGAKRCFNCGRGTC